jgi:hypothetical protein
MPHERVLIKQSETGSQFLKHERVDVNAQHGKGESALISASDKGHVEVVCQLGVKHESTDVNAKDDDECAAKK